MGQKNVKWLTNEIPQLIKAGIISDQQAVAIKNYFTEKDTNKPNTTIVAFSIIGSTLLAAGIILLLAHNWSNLSRLVRICISYIPLVIAQGIGLWVIIKKRESLAWSEGIGAFGFLAIGATISLISQTYHIQGDFRNFIFNWMILGFPLLYIYRSTTAAIFYIACVTIWAIAENMAIHNSIGYWPLIALIIPFYLMNYRNANKRNTTSVLSWFISISLVFGVFNAIVDFTEGFKFISLISLFLSLLSLGFIYFKGEEAFWKNSFSRIGLLGLSIIYIVLSYRDIWKGLSYSLRPEALNLTGFIKICNIIISLSLPIFALVITYVSFKIKKWPITLFAIGLPLSLLGFSISNSDWGRVIITIAFNIYVLTCGLYYLINGVKTNSGKAMNYGFIMMAAIIIVRFFDSDLSFITRGLVFIVLGLCFLGANIYLAKRKAASK